MAPPLDQLLAGAAMRAQLGTSGVCTGAGGLGTDASARFPEERMGAPLGLSAVTGQRSLHHPHGKRTLEVDDDLLRHGPEGRPGAPAEAEEDAPSGGK